MRHCNVLWLAALLSCDGGSVTVADGGPAESCPALPGVKQEGMLGYVR